MTSMPGAGIQAGAPAQPADLVLRDAKIFTGDPKRPAAIAHAVRDGSVTVVGGDREVAPLVLGAPRRAGPERLAQPRRPRRSVFRPRTPVGRRADFAAGSGD